MSENTTQLPSISPQQQRFVHLYMTGQYKLQQIAELLGVTIRTLRNWLYEEEIKQLIEEFQMEEHEAVELGIKNLRKNALEKMNELIQSDNDMVALQACKDVLDRAGHKAVQKVEKSVTITTYEQQMKDLIETTCIDVEVE